MSITSLQIKLTEKRVKLPRALFGKFLFCGMLGVLTSLLCLSISIGCTFNNTISHWFSGGCIYQTSILVT